MKRAIAASLLLACFFVGAPCFADTDPSGGDASELSELSCLSAIATPILLYGAVAAGTESTAERIVKITSATGEGLSELTSDVIDDASDSSVTASDSNRTRASSDVTISNSGATSSVSGTAPSLTVKKKQIPLVVRKDYLELNQRVKIK